MLSTHGRFRAQRPSQHENDGRQNAPQLLEEALCSRELQSWSACIEEERPASRPILRRLDGRDVDNAEAVAHCIHVLEQYAVVEPLRAHVAHA